MHIDQARTLKAVLDKAIAEAETAGSDEVELHIKLDQALGAAIDEAQAVLDAAKKGQS